MFNLHNLYKSLTLFIRLNLNPEGFKGIDECQKIPNKDLESKSLSGVPTHGLEYKFSQDDSTYNVFDKLNIAHFYNTPEERIAFDKAMIIAFDKAMIIDSEKVIKPLDIFKLDVTHGEKTSKYILSIIRNGNKIMDYDLNKQKIQPIIDKAKETLLECRTGLDDLILNVKSEQKNKANEEKWSKEKKTIISNCAKNPVQGEFCGETNAPISDTVKVLKDLNIMESITLLKKIFGEGPGTELLVNIDKGSTFAIKRMITLAEHEGKLLFGRQNKDPRSGNNVGVFQIGGKNSTPRKSLNKYTRCLDAGVELAKEKGIKIDYESLINSPSQRDLIAHLGYIKLERGGDSVLDKLSDSNLSKKETTQLMSRRIQGGSPAIGRNIFAMLNTKKIDISQINGSKNSA